jgi:predicted transcriptional regulator
MSRNAFIYKLHLLGWTQEEIGELVELDQSGISRIMQELNQLNLVIKSDYFDKQKKPEDIAEYYRQER